MIKQAVLFEILSALSKEEITTLAHRLEAQGNKQAVYVLLKNLEERQKRQGVEAQKGK